MGGGGGGEDGPAAELSFRVASSSTFLSASRGRLYRSVLSGGNITRAVRRTITWAPM